MRRARFLTILGILVLAWPQGSWAAKTILNHNTDNTSEGYAVCLASPRQETYGIRINRIRITLDKATATTYTFSYKRTSDSLFDTTSLSGAGCISPACAVVLAVEGVRQGELVDLQDLNLELPRGARLYMNTDADIGAAYQTLEVFYTQY